MKVIVLGSSGFIGRNFIKLKNKSNNEYYFFSNSKKKFDGINFIQCDLNNYLEFKKKIIIIQPDICLDLSWFGIPDYSSKTNKLNYTIKKKIYKILVQNKCRKIISIGSCWEYGNNLGIKSEKISNIKNLNSFAKTKVNTLKILENYHNKKLVDFIWIRLFFVYGIYGKKTSLLESLVKLYKKNKNLNIYDKYSYNDFIYIKDVITFIEAFMNKEKFTSGVYNLGYGKSINNYNFLRIFNNLVNKKRVVCKNIYSTKQGLISDMTKTIKYLNIKPKFSLKKGLTDYLIESKII